MNQRERVINALISATMLCCIANHHDHNKDDVRTSHAMPQEHLPERDKKNTEQIKSEQPDQITYM